MAHARVYIIGVCLLFSSFARAIDLPCDNTGHPQVCAFLNRYITELEQWNEPNISLPQKMRDDKFVLLEGALENLSQVNDSTSFSLVRYDNKAYEASWANGQDLLLRVAFPIQYELILGMPQIEIEQHLQEHIMSAPQRNVPKDGDIQLDSIAPNVYRSAPKQHYQIQSLNNCMYFHKNDIGELQLIRDSAKIEYTIANLFQNGLEKTYLLQVSQSVYGFKNLNYTISLQQWLNYCIAEHLMCYVAIEGTSDEAIQVLIVAENIDLAYNHLLSILIPRKALGDVSGTLLVKLNAFIPTHNITNLYEQYTTKPKKQREWIKD